MAHQLLARVWNIDTKQKARVEELNEREYIVVPMSMILEGVHAGSEGAIYYSKSELSKTPYMWNMKPITVRHPAKGVTATELDVYKKQAIGMIMHTQWKDDKLKAEAWIDTKLAKKTAPTVLQHIEYDIPMEVSTGLFADCVLEEGTWNDEHYDAIATNIRADHLAILPDKSGACSIQDGAGLLVNQAQTQDANLHPNQTDKTLTEILELLKGIQMTKQIKNDSGFVALDQPSATQVPSVSQGEGEPTKTIVQIGTKISHNELYDILRQALQTQYASDKDTWINLMDVFDTFAIFAISNRNDQRTTYKIDYVVDEADRKITLGKELSEVIDKRVYATKDGLILNKKPTEGDSPDDTQQVKDNQNPITNEVNETNKLLLQLLEEIKNIGQTATIKNATTLPASSTTVVVDDKLVPAAATITITPAEQTPSKTPVVELGASDKRILIETAIGKTKKGTVNIQDVFDSFVVYTVWDQSEVGTTNTKWKIGYTLVDGVVSLVGEPVVVKSVIVYVDSNGVALNASEETSRAILGATAESKDALPLVANAVPASPGTIEPTVVTPDTTTVVPELGINDKRNLIQTALGKIIDGRLYIQDMFDTFIIYSVYNNNSIGNVDGTTWWKVGYSIKDNEATIEGTPIEVRSKVTYIDANGIVLNASEEVNKTITAAIDNKFAQVGTVTVDVPVPKPVKGLKEATPEQKKAIETNLVIYRDAILKMTTRLYELKEIERKKATPEQVKEYKEINEALKKIKEEALMYSRAASSVGVAVKRLGF